MATIIIRHTKCGSHILFHRASSTSIRSTRSNSIGVNGRRSKRSGRRRNGSIPGNLKPPEINPVGQSNTAIIQTILSLPLQLQRKQILPDGIETADIVGSLTPPIPRHDRRAVLHDQHLHRGECIRRRTRVIRRSSVVQRRPSLPIHDRVGGGNVVRLEEGAEDVKGSVLGSQVEGRGALGRGGVQGEGGAREGWAWCAVFEWRWVRREEGQGEGMVVRGESCCEPVRWIVWGWS